MFQEYECEAMDQLSIGSKQAKKNLLSHGQRAVLFRSMKRRLFCVVMACLSAGGIPRKNTIPSFICIMNVSPAPKKTYLMADF